MTHDLRSDLLIPDMISWVSSRRLFLVCQARVYYLLYEGNVLLLSISIYLYDESDWEDPVLPQNI
jgi:hypothetical protein